MFFTGKKFDGSSAAPKGRSCHGRDGMYQIKNTWTIGTVPTAEAKKKKEQVRRAKIAADTGMRLAP